ncbi:bcl-2-related ovarian killer protein isoform X3 [Camelus ferus]|uniref:Bcl-2-related ovarian killer protein isoform X3 n=2 Tax=Camelus TaxID=9836 RepID=A0A8B8T3F0_CAMFR|nr:bcl-2-related ovarian killer protein isoform X3 [Camelus ferus]
MAWSPKVFSFMSSVVSTLAAAQHDPHLTLPQHTPTPPQHRHPAPRAATNRKKPRSSPHADELELIRPSIYRNVARQLNISLQSETVVTDAFLAVAAQIFSAGITWGKVVSLYSVAAGLAVDCVRQAQPAMVHALVDCLGEFVRKTLATWLRRRGGWTDVLKCVVSTDPGLRSHWLVAVLCSCGRFLKAAFFMLLPER